MIYCNTIILLHYVRCITFCITLHSLIVVVSCFSYSLLLIPGSSSISVNYAQARLAGAVKVKVSGNEAFKLGQFPEALEHYSQSLDLCPLKYSQQRSIMFSNRAACRTKEVSHQCMGCFGGVFVFHVSNSSAIYSYAGVAEKLHYI